MQKGERRPEKGWSSSPIVQGTSQGPPGLLGALTTELRQDSWNSPAFHVGLLSPAGSRLLLPGGLKSASSWGPSPVAWGNPGVPYLPQPSGNPSASCCLGLRAKSLPLGSHPQRPRVLKFKLRDCQSSLKTAEYFSEGGGGERELREAKT